MKLTEAGKEEIALALILLRDFKCQGKFDPEILIGILKLAKFLEVNEQYDRLQSKIPPMKITPRK